MAQTKPLSEMSKEELTAELDTEYIKTKENTFAPTATFHMVKCLVLIGMLQLKNRE